MKVLSVFIAPIVLALAGCATGGDQAYSDAHASAAKARIAEANAKAEGSKTLALAMASTAKACTSDLCVMSAMMQLATMNALASVGATAQTAAAAIAPPVNVALEWGKVLVPAATQIAGGYFSTVLGIVNSTKSVSAANTDVAIQGLNSITPVAPWAPTPEK